MQRRNLAADARHQLVHTNNITFTSKENAEEPKQNKAHKFTGYLQCLVCSS